MRHTRKTSRRGGGLLKPLPRIGLSNSSFRNLQQPRMIHLILNVTFVFLQSNFDSSLSFTNVRFPSSITWHLLNNVLMYLHSPIYAVTSFVFFFIKSSTFLPAVKVTLNASFRVGLFSFRLVLIPVTLNVVRLFFCFHLLVDFSACLKPSFSDRITTLSDSYLDLVKDEMVH